MIMNCYQLNWFFKFKSSCVKFIVSKFDCVYRLGENITLRYQHKGWSDVVSAPGYRNRADVLKDFYYQQEPF